MLIRIEMFFLKKLEDGFFEQLVGCV